MVDPQWSLVTVFLGVSPLEPKRCKANFTRHSTKAATRKPAAGLIAMGKKATENMVFQESSLCESVVSLLENRFSSMVYQWFTMVYPMKM